MGSQIIDRPWKRFTVDETVEFNGQAPYPDYVHEETKHEWRVAEGGETFQDDTNKLLNTDMCLAWAIGDGDDVNDETCDTRAGTTEPVERQGVVTTCGPQDASWADPVAAYAADNTLFLTDFAAAWQKMTEMTASTLCEVGTECSDGTTTTTDAPATTSAPTPPPTTATTTATTATTTAT